MSATQICVSLEHMNIVGYEHSRLSHDPPHALQFERPFNRCIILHGERHAAFFHDHIQQAGKRGYPVLNLVDGCISSSLYVLAFRCLHDEIWVPDEGNLDLANIIET